MLAARARTANLRDVVIEFVSLHDVDSRHFVRVSRAGCPILANK